MAAETLLETNRGKPRAAELLRGLEAMDVTTEAWYKQVVRNHTLPVATTNIFFLVRTKATEETDR